MEILLRDVRHAVRLLLKERTFSATVVLTLAVCIGANVAIYSVIHTVLLEPLPFAEPDRLVTVYNSYPGAGAERGSNGFVDFFERREGVDAFEDVAIYQGWGSTVGEAGSTQRVTSVRVSPSFFPLLGVEAAQGRTFTEEEREVGNHLKAVLTHGYALERFASASAAVGQVLRVDGRPHTVVGVLAEDFHLPDRSDVRFFLPVPFEADDRDLDNWHNNNFRMMARLAPGASIEQARAQNVALNQSLIERWGVPNAAQLLEDAGYTTVVVPTASDLVRNVRGVLYMLGAGVGLVLLIGCVNIANLMLARARIRVGEVATRLALGASRARVARQALTEAVVAAVTGGALGLAVGALGLRLLLRFGAGELPRGTEIGIDVPVVLFTLGLAVAAGALIGAIPTIQIMRGDLSSVFRAEGRGGTASRRAVLLRNGMVVGQVALAFVLLIGAGLMFASFRAALSVDPGFEPEGVFSARLALPSARYEDAGARRRLLESLVRGVRALPGVEAAGVTAHLPFTGNTSSSVIFPEGYAPAPGESLLSPLQTRVGPGYFDAMGIDVLRGRAFEPSDGPDARGVIILDEWLAERYWPDGGAVGQRMVYGQVPGTDSVPDESLYTIVGVVSTVKQNDLTAPASEHTGAYYLPYLQQTPVSVALVARVATGDPALLTSGVRAALVRLDAELPLFDVRTMERRIDASLASRRIPLVLLGVFAGVALFLAVVGIYGALAYSVAQRRREIGIRMAMGSAPADVFRGVVAEGMGVTTAGLALGGGATLLLTRLVRSLLFGVRPADPGVMFVVALVLAAVGLAACVIPARRATAVNPVEALSA